MSEILIIIMRFVGALLVLTSGTIGIFAAVRKYQTWNKRRTLAENELSSKFLNKFNSSEINHFLSGYVIPKCAPSDQLIKKVKNT